jgi:hypothetical protein
MPKRTPWTKKRPNKELILAAALEYNTLKEFKSSYNAGYWNAMRYGLLPEILQSMKTRRIEPEKKND